VRDTVTGVTPEAIVIAVSRAAEHAFSKANADSIMLLAGLGVAEDAHQGVTVKHRSRVRRDASRPNLRQVHLIHAELQDELDAAGFTVRPGELGENVTTRGLDLLALRTGTQLRLGPSAVIEITGLRNPCVQLDAFQHGLMRLVLDRAEDGSLIRKAGIMAVVLTDGEVRPGDPIGVDVPSGPHRPLEPV
jgi:hypothetical protein